MLLSDYEHTICATHHSVYINGGNNWGNAWYPVLIIKGKEIYAAVSFVPADTRRGNTRREIAPLQMAEAHR